MNISDGAFSFLTGVTEMKFANGKFSSLSSTAFTGMTSLQSLFFYDADMPRTGVPSGLLSGLTSLKTIKMIGTMYSLPSGLFDDLKDLETLDLNWAGLTTLPADLFYPLLSLTSLTLENNDWVCDCDLQWLGRYLNYTRLTNATCGSPAALAGKDLQRSVLSLECSTTTTTTTAKTTAGTTATTTKTTTTPATYTVNNLKLYLYALIGGVSLALILATIACICLCRNNRKLRKPKQSCDSRNEANDQNNMTISNSSNWEQENDWYLPSGTYQSSRSPHSTCEPANDLYVRPGIKSPGRRHRTPMTDAF